MKFSADSLPDDPVLLKQMLLLAHGKVAQLQEQVALLRHKLFSPKSERSPEDADSPQLAMFNEAEELIEAPVSLLSTSPERDDTILVRDPFQD